MNQQSNQSREPLNKQNPNIRSSSPKHPSNEHTAQEKHAQLHSEGRVRVHNAPEQSRGEEPVVHPLGLGEGLGLLCEFGRELECPPASGRGPEEGF